jgi:UBX domain-containing protein 6
VSQEHDVEPLTTSAVIIHTLSHDNKDGRKLCIDTICRYIDNIMSHPDDEKYRKIRLYNKAFQERVAHIEGALMFLEAIGFEKKCLPHEGKDEEFYVLPNQVSCDSLNTYKELLLSTEPVTPSLHHNPQVYISNIRSSQ